MKNSKENLLSPRQIASTNVKSMIQEASDGLRMQEAHMDSQAYRTLATNMLGKAASIGDALVGLSSEQNIDVENVIEQVKEGCDDCLIDNPIISVDDESLKAVEAALSLADATGDLAVLTQKSSMEEEKIDYADAANAIGRAMLCLIVLSKQFNIDPVDALATYYANKKSNRRG